jgi:hypothetical protein
MSPLEPTSSGNLEVSLGEGIAKQDVMKACESYEIRA